MNLPFRKRSGVQSNAIIPEMNGPVQPASGRQINWQRLILAVVVGLVLLGALIWGGISVSNRNTSHPTTVATTSKSTQPNQSNKPSSPSSTQSSKSSSPNTTSTTNNPNAAPQTSSGQQQTQAQAANGNLTNSGPGDVIAIFAAASVVGTGIYHLAMRKKLS